MNKAKLVKISILVLSVVCLFGAVYAVFFQTVEPKFDRANEKVVSDVTFGPGGGYYDEEEAWDYNIENEVTFGGPPHPAQRQKTAMKAELQKQKADQALQDEILQDQVAAMRQKLASDSENVEFLARRASQNNPDMPQADVNPMIQVIDDPLSTFSIDVDTGSYTLMRRMIHRGQLPPVDAVRVEEMINYFDYNYPNPQQGAFGVTIAAAPSPFEPAKNRKIVRVGVQGTQLNSTSRKTRHLTFLVDVSGSMFGWDRMRLVKQTLRIVAGNLEEGDTMAITTYAGRVETILEPTQPAEGAKIDRAIGALKTGGSTRMGDGLQLAYRTALKSFVAEDVNRVIVLTDGDANVGPQSSDELFKSIRNYVEEGVTLSTIGFGMGNYKDETMEQLANKGNGNYYYVDSKDEAQKVFGEQLDATLQVIAKDVKIQVEFDRDAVIAYRLIGYENRDIADADFRKDRVDAGEIGAGHSVTALYEVVLTDSAARGQSTAPLATVRIRAKKPNGVRAVEQAFELTVKDVYPSLADASDSFQFATAVAGFAEILRDSPYAKSINLALIEELAKSASQPEQTRRQEFIEIVATARKLKRN